MTIKLSPATHKLIKRRMKKDGHSDPDAAIRLALQTMEELDAEPIDALDPETQAAIKRGWNQAESGQTRPWSEVKAALRALAAQ